MFFFFLNTPTNPPKGPYNSHLFIYFSLTTLILLSTRPFFFLLLLFFQFIYKSFPFLALFQNFLFLFPNSFRLFFSLPIFSIQNFFLYIIITYYLFIHSFIHSFTVHHLIFSVLDLSILILFIYLFNSQLAVHRFHNIDTIYNRPFLLSIFQSEKNINQTISIK